MVALRCNLFITIHEIYYTCAFIHVHVSIQTHLKHA